MTAKEKIKEKLVELIGSTPCVGFSSRAAVEHVANWLVQNGVTVQKHGRWLLDGRCSECLENPLTTHKTYCPSCGAKMDLER